MRQLDDYFLFLLLMYPCISFSKRLSSRTMSSQSTPGGSFKRKQSPETYRQHSHTRFNTQLNGALNSSTTPNVFHAVKVCFICTACGIVFGLVLEKGRVFEPSVIREQMLFKKFIMLKMFLSAVSTGMLCLSLMAMLPQTKSKFLRAGQLHISCYSNKGLLSSVVGAAVLGIGMTLSGACPGMVLVQVGAGVTSAVYTMIGALVGAAIYGIVEPIIVKLTKPSQPITIHTLNQWLQAPYFIIALPMAAMLATVVFALEVFVPWQSEVAVTDPTTAESGILAQYSRPPYVAGAIIGLLQVPTVLVVGETLGGSTGYCTLVSQALVTEGSQKSFPYLNSFRSGINNWWQVFYVGGAVFGGYISSSSSQSWGTITGQGHLESLLGGALMLFGARLAAGCTSGHGISGMGLLSLLSFLAVPSMFAGAIATAVVMATTMS